MASEALKKKAQQAVCPCYFYEVANEIDSITSEDLNRIVLVPYYCHLINDDDVKECPEWQHAQAELIRDGMREDGINV